MSSSFKIPKPASTKEIEEFFKTVGLEILIESSYRYEHSGNEMIQENPYPPDLADLYRLYQFIVLNRRITVLEFGCGWSSLVMAHALESNRISYFEEVKNLRRNNPFQISILDNEEKFLKIAQSRLDEAGLNNAKFMSSDVVMTKFNDRLVNQYQRLPQINPDFIYLDGPDQFNPSVVGEQAVSRSLVKGLVSGLSIAHKDFMPMSSDILLVEHFLTPGTIILVDGRTANARFLKCNLQRKWSYIYQEEYDQSLFVLEEEPLGKYSRLQLEFYSKT